MALQGVLFDLDGTLAETEPLWRQAYRELAATHGVALEEGWWSTVIGRDLGDAAVALLGGDIDTPQRRREAVEHLVDSAVALLGERATETEQLVVEWRPGARDLLGDLVRSQVPTAVVTATPRRLLDALAHHLGIEVEVTVAGDEVERPKPDPEGYRTAAQRLGIDVEEAVVVEDSPTGVAAAAASGARVLAVPAGVPIPPTPGCTVVDSLVEVTPQMLATLP